ncbi:hypothetical protein [Streptomyces sp. WMMB303]|uniref:hypothetical protein n=1 Tax=Streptomyces sp. WMMB303 TaxID=3034154 RepID=UPI0023ED9015|nr:hypothetical protein [Streptomyces sp. WMMB303]MDF4254000.1 hypothetical protein [Streptomyces sp. WMMB303]
MLKLPDGKTSGHAERQFANRLISAPKEAQTLEAWHGILRSLALTPAAWTDFLAYAAAG